jgi:hypothetical protein
MDHSDGPMSSPTAKDLEDDIIKHGFTSIQDVRIGSRVKDFRDRGLRLNSADGLTFCKESVLDDSV